jgi:hypothetical protein
MNRRSGVESANAARRDDEEMLMVCSSSLNTHVSNFLEVVSVASSYIDEDITVSILLLEQERIRRSNDV